MRTSRNLRLPALLVLVAGSLQFVGCTGKGKKSDDKNSGKINAVCTTPQVADVVRNVGGDHVSVTVIMGEEGDDPHEYQPSQKQIGLLQKADIVFYSGHHLEGQFDRIFAKMKDKPTLALAQAIPSKDLIKEEEAVDPHIWFNPKLWKLTAKPVAEALAKLDADHKDEFIKNATAYENALDKLHDEITKTLSVVPKERRVLVTSHDAFSYFGAAFDIRVNAVQGISTQQEWSIDDVKRIVSILVKEKVPAYFVEKSTRPESLNAIERGAKEDHGFDVKSGGSLFSDSMGKAGTTEGTYAGMMRYNAKTIADALGKK